MRAVKQLFRKYLKGLDDKAKARLAKVPAGEFPTDEFYHPGTKGRWGKLVGAGGASVGGYKIGSKDDPQKKKAHGGPITAAQKKKISAYVAAGGMTRAEANNLLKVNSTVKADSVLGRVTARLSQEQKVKIGKSTGDRDFKGERALKKHDDQHANQNMTHEERMTRARKKAKKTEGHGYKVKAAADAEQGRGERIVNAATLTGGDDRKIKNIARKQLPEQIGRLQQAGQLGKKGTPERDQWEKAHKNAKEQYIAAYTNRSKGRKNYNAGEQHAWRQTYADKLMKANPGLSREKANAQAWRKQNAGGLQQGQQSSKVTIRSIYNTLPAAEQKVWDKNMPLTVAGAEGRKKGDLDKLGRAAEKENKKLGQEGSDLPGATDVSKARIKKDIKKQSKGGKEDVTEYPLVKDKKTGKWREMTEKEKFPVKGRSNKGKKVSQNVVVYNTGDLSGPRDKRYGDWESNIQEGYDKRRRNFAIAAKKRLAAAGNPPPGSDEYNKVLGRNKPKKAPGIKGERAGDVIKKLPHVTSNTKKRKNIGDEKGLGFNPQASGGRKKTLDKEGHVVNKPTPQIPDEDSAKTRKKVGRAMAASSAAKKITKVTNRARRQLDAESAADAEREKNLSAQITQMFFERKKEDRKGRRLATGAVIGSLGGAEAARRFIQHDIPARHRAYDEAGHSSKQPTGAGKEANRALYDQVAPEGQDLQSWAKGKEKILGKHSPSGFRRKVFSRAAIRALTGTGLGIAAGGIYHHAKQKRDRRAA